MFGFEGTALSSFIKASWLSWLERRPVTAEVVGSSPIGVARMKIRYFNSASLCKGTNSLKTQQQRFSDVLHGILAQLGEHLPYKQRVTGSSPEGPILFIESLNVTIILVIFSMLMWLNS